MKTHVHGRRLAWLLAALAMVGPFAIDGVFPAFVQIGQQFDADTLQMQQTISIYLIAYAVMSVVHGPLSDALGRRRVILVGVVVFLLASVGCALATSLPMLLLFRAIQGMSAGVGMVVGRAVIRDVLDGPAAQKLMSQVMMIFSIAPAVAPIMGGWILGWQRWPAIFWFLVMFSGVLLVALWRWLPETHPQHARISLSPGPLLRGYLRMFVRPAFQRLAAAAAFNFSALFLYVASAPAIIFDLLGLGEQDFGWLFVPVITGMMLGAYVSGRAAGTIKASRLAGLGFSCSAVAILANFLMYLFVDQPVVPWAVLPMALHGFGVALVFPILTLAILDMYPNQRGSASSLQAATSLALNALVTGLLSPLVSHAGILLAIGAGVFLMIAAAFWFWEIASRRQPPTLPDEPMALEVPEHP